MSRLRRLLRDRRGSAAIEFALVAPILLLLMAGILELGMIVLAHVLLEGGAREAARFGVTGGMPAGVSREDRIKEIVAGHSVGMIDLSEVEIETLVYDSFASIGQSEPFEDCMGTGTYHPDCPFTDINGNGVWDEDLGVAGLGGAGDVVLYRMFYDWQVVNPMMRPFLRDDGTIRLEASLAVRNEPYHGSQQEE